MPEPTWDPFATAQQPAPVGWNPFAEVPKPKSVNKPKTPDSLPGSKNFPDVVIPGVTKPVVSEEPEMIEVEGQMVPAPVGGKHSVWNPIPVDTSKNVDLTQQFDKAKATVQGFVEKNQPWTRAGMTKAQWDALSFADKVKAQAGNVGRSTKDVATQYMTAPVRAVSGIGRGLAGLGQMALENIDNGTTTQLEDKGLAPAGTVEGEFAPVMPAGVRTTAVARDVTGASLSKKIQDVQLSSSAWMDHHGLNPLPTTPEGEVARVGSDVATDIGLTALAPGSTFATKGTALGLGLGGRAAGQTFNEATLEGLPLKNKNLAALGEGSLNAALVGFPISHAAEGMLGADTVLKKLPLGAAEGWGIGQLSNSVRKSTGLSVDESPMAQFTSALQGAGMKLAQPSVNPTKTFDELPRFTGETPVAQQMQGQTVGGLERLLASAPDRRLGSQAVARNYFDVLGQHPDEVMREVRDYHDAQVAGTKPPMISLEAQSVLDSPAWKQLMEDQATLRNKLQVARGLNEDANLHHIPRVITGGVEPSAPGNATKMRTGTNSDLARSIFAVENQPNEKTLSPSELNDILDAQHKAKGETDYRETALPGMVNTFGSFQKGQINLADVKGALSKVQEGHTSQTNGPVVYDPVSNTIIDGNHRVVDALRRGDTTIDAYIGQPKGTPIEQPIGRTIVSKDSPEAQGKTLLPATSAEIEAQTPIKVRQNPVQSVIDNNIQMQTALDNRAIINQINSSEFARPKTEAPAGFLPLEGAAKKVLDPSGEKVYDPRVKTMIEKSLADHADPNILDNLNRGIVQFGFANPTVHTPNVINHGYISGMLKIASSPKMAMQAQDRASDAVNSIMAGRPNADAIEVMRAGGRMMVPDQILARNAESRANGEPSINQQARDEAFGNTNDQYKIGKPGGVMDAINQMNQKYTWSTDSKARLFNYFLHQAKTGGSLADSIHEVDRAVYPNYRQTYNEMEGTGAVPQLANAASNFAYNTPGLALFGSYNKAATKIAALMAKDLGPADSTVPPEVASQRRADAASHVAATVIGLGLVYPVLGKALQAIEGGDEKEAFVGGSAHKTQLFLRAVEDKDWTAASRIAGVNINPVVALGAYANGVGALKGRSPNARDLMDAQSFAANGDLSSAGKAVKNWAGDAAAFAGGAVNYAAPQIAEAMAGKKDMKTVVLDQLTRGKNVPTDAERLYNKFYSDKAPTVKATWDKEDEEDAKKAMGKAIKDGDFAALSNVISSGNIDPDLVEKTVDKLSMPKEFRLAAKAKGLSFEDQIRLWRVSSPAEQKAMLALGLGDEIMKHAEPKDNALPGKLMNTKAFIDNWIATRKL